jgi:hypothetical protein
VKISDAKRRAFLHWVSERDSIQRKKESGEPAPWTKDRILRAYRFCNVRRKDDRVSRWIIEHLINARGNDRETLWIELALARYINWPPTINALMEAGLWIDGDARLWKRNPEEVFEAIGGFLDRRVMEGHQTWTGAYMVRAESNPDAPWYSWGKGRYVANIVIGQLWAARDAVEPFLYVSVKNAHEVLMENGYGWGSFMAGQVVADLTYTPMLRNAPDLYTWAPLGPGSRRGLNRLTGRGLTESWKIEDAVRMMVRLREDIIEHLGRSFNDLTLHDVQNCLCEVDKYLRVKNGEGRPRSLYRPAPAELFGAAA